VSARNTGAVERNIVHFKHECGADVVVVATADMYGAFRLFQLAGTAGHAQVVTSDSFYAFKAQLQAFINYLRTAVRPFPFAETIELMQMLIAGICSREEDGRGGSAN